MNQNTVIFLTTALLACCLSPSAFGEEPHRGHHHHHDTQGVELGFSAGYFRLKNEKEDAPGLHMHLSRRLQQDGLLHHFALGVGGEVIFADEAHYAVMLPLLVYPWRGLVLSAAPGMVFAEHDGNWESDYATHLEAAYVFELGEYDVGPVVGYSSSSEDKHYMAGLHFGVHF